MKDRFLWFCAGWAAAVLTCGVIAAREIERHIVGVGDEYVRKAREVTRE